MTLIEVDESKPNSIASAVQATLSAAASNSVGLNYTGGTKAMSVHAYRTVERWAMHERLEPVFSYLDARTLEMVFDPVDCASGEQRIYVGRELELRLEDLLALHGWTLKHDPTRTPVLGATARAVAKACATDEGFANWKQWVGGTLRLHCRRVDGDDWKSNEQLRSVSLKLPTDDSLSEVIQLLRSELQLTGGDLSLVHDAFENRPRRFCRWLDGIWLEHYVLDCLNVLAVSLHINERAQNIVPNQVEFDLDVVALRGYQLFAFSCSTDQYKSQLKLFEAFIRARQLGGDESRVALVCCSNDPDAVEHEMRRDIDPEGRIRVFGRKHLADLATHVAQWIQSQSGEER